MCMGLKIIQHTVEFFALEIAQFASNSISTSGYNIVHNFKHIALSFAKTLQHLMTFQLSILKWSCDLEAKIVI